MKTVIVTGASDGIGRAIAVEILKEQKSINLVLIGRDIDKLKETQALIGKTNISLIVFDLTCLDEIPNMIEKIYIKYDSIDCLINVAGYTEPQPLLQTTKENLLKTYTINVFAPMILARECAKYMKQSDVVNKILNVASTAGITPRPGWLSYASSKAALISMSQTMSEELSEYNIKVYVVSPGRCATNLRRKLAPNEDQTKIMQPTDVAKIIANLINDNETCLDGQNIIIRKKAKV